MGLVDIGAVALPSAGGNTPIDLRAAGDDACEVKLANESPLTLTVEIGNDTHKLGAWVVDKFALCGQTRIQVISEQIQSPTPAGVPSNTVLVTVAPVGESIPGSYPAALPRMANVQSPQSDRGSLSVPAGTTGASGVFSVPAGAHSIGILIESGAQLSSLSVTGVQSGTQYLLLPPAGGSGTISGFAMSLALGGVDSQVTVSAVSTNGATLEVVALLQPAAVYVFNNATQPLSTGLVSAQQNPIGDLAAQALAADQGTESTTLAPGAISSTSAALASFKPAAGLTPALVKAGALATGTALAVNPAYGQATTAGNIAIAVVSGRSVSSADPAVVGAGWVKIVSSNSGAAMHLVIYAKFNIGAGEVAPQFTLADGITDNMRAILLEYSGVLAAAPTDATGGVFVSAGAASLTVNATAADLAPGDLVVAGWIWRTAGSNSTGTFAQTMNNSTVVVHVADDGATSGEDHISISYGVVPAFKTPIPLGVAPWPYDATGSSVPATGSQATVTLAASPGKAYTAHHLAASLISVAAVATAPSVELDDGATVLWKQWLGLSATAESEQHFEPVGLAYKGTAGNTMTLKFSAGLANIAQAVNIGAYLR